MAQIMSFPKNSLIFTWGDRLIFGARLKRPLETAVFGTSWSQGELLFKSPYG